MNTKRYGPSAALDGVSLEFRPGEVHVLFGENGAGKSTLISMIGGAREPSSGAIEIGGQSCRFDSVATARAHLVRAVFQEFSLIPYLTVATSVEKDSGTISATAPCASRALQILNRRRAFTQPARPATGDLCHPRRLDTKLALRDAAIH
jgi:ABC-type sugar transport system ATPase subunit